MHSIAILVSGLVVGWLAATFMRGNSQRAILANSILGVAGSYLGLLTAHAAGLGPQGHVGSWAVSLLGAALLIALVQALGFFKGPAAARLAPWPAGWACSSRRSSAVTLLRNE